MLITMAIARHYTNSLVLVSGSVIIDFPDDLPSSLPPEIQVYSTRVSLTYANLAEMLPIFQEQWALGRRGFPLRGN
jgi:inner membrane protein